MVGWVGTHPSAFSLHLFADADFAGCTKTAKSTSGIYFRVQGPATCFSLSDGFKRQDGIRHSTPEAEMVAADAAVRLEGIPALSLWSRLCGKELELHLR